ncbi:MAG: zinc-binding dehydrogenase, partial [Propionibacteriaceae bacterium]|nr:zinc-binding dehydrogenase [Propionibacteriaceae bacterium]
KGARGTLDLGVLQSKQGSVTATGLRHRPLHEKAAICGGIVQRVWPLMASGAIKPAATSRFAMQDAAAAHRQLESGDNMGKIVLTL